jgi:hypothetical protein
MVLITEISVYVRFRSHGKFEHVMTRVFWLHAYLCLMLQIC